MTNSSPKGSSPRSSMFTISLILGLLLIPVSAVAAAAVISNDEAPAQEAGAAVAVAEAPSSTVATTEAKATETVFVTEPPTSTQADLEAACGVEGRDLVEREAAGEITDIEKAALDALRQICAEEGLELPGGLELVGPPVASGVARSVTASIRPAATAVDSTTTTTMADEVFPDAAAAHDAQEVAEHDDDYDDYDDHEDDYEDDHEDDHEDDYEDDHEDEDHHEEEDD